MKIIVCIKQIPDTNDVKWSKDNNLIREGLISIINPNDLLAIQTALSIKNKIKDTKITLLSMGVLSCADSLRYGLAMGADDAVLLSDNKFRGSDTLATAYTLSCAIRNKIKEYDIILTGQFAKDGDTAQTPYSLSRFLDIDIIGYTTKINKIENGKICAISTKDAGKYVIEASLPAVLAVSKCEDEIYKPKVKDYIEAEKKELKIFGAEDIAAEYGKIGIKGSPTYVSRAFKPENKRSCVFLNENFAENVIKIVKGQNG